MHFSKLFISDMGIDLRCSDGRMSEHGLYGTYVSAITQEIGSI